jgi:hypothetical protein
LAAAHTVRRGVPVHALHAVIALIGVSTVSCSDATGGFVAVALCPQANWAAIAMEGRLWQSISPVRAALPLRAGERIGLARLRGTPFQPDSLEIYYVTAEQAEGTFDCDVPATKRELHGTTVGIGGAFTSATIAMGHSLGYATAGGLTNFTLWYPPGGPADLVAIADDLGPAVIIRRGVDYPDGSAIPVLDFSSGEAFVLQTNTVTPIGTTPYEWDATSEVITQRGTRGVLRNWYPEDGSTTASMYSVPATKLLDGELNSVSVSDGYRTATVFYRLASDLTIELGRLASVPTVTRTGTAPNRLLRIDLASQPEYGSQITLVQCGIQPVLQGPTLIATKEYFGGTPTTWSITIPDLQVVQGFPSYLPDPRLSGLCGINVTDRPYLVAPRDGDTYRSALILEVFNPP